MCRQGEVQLLLQSIAVGVDREVDDGSPQEVVVVPTEQGCGGFVAAADLTGCIDGEDRVAGGCMTAAYSAWIRYSVALETARAAAVQASKQ